MVIELFSLPGFESFSKTLTIVNKGYFANHKYWTQSIVKDSTESFSCSLFDILLLIN